jgi:MYXO-CTERM domain-containing protein
MSHRSRVALRCLACLALAGLALVACGPGGGENVGTTSQAITFPNDQPVFDYFVGKGLTPFQAAGIVGNLDQESGVDPTAAQMGGPGRGIAQWSVGGRWDTDANDNAEWYAGTQNQSVDSLQLQLDFIWYELTTFSNYGLASLKATTNVTDATVAFETDFEGCGQCDQSTRVSYAETVLAAFGSGPFDASVPSGDSGVDAGAPCTVTTTGLSGVCIDTSACAALGGHMSTPDYCPGAANIQCCTATPGAGGEDAGNPVGTSDASILGTGTGTGTGGKDAGIVHSGTPDSGGGHGQVLDASIGTSPQHPGGDEDGGAGGFGADPGSGGGCSTAPSGGSAGSWLVAVVALLSLRRRRPSSGPRRAGSPT